MKNRAVLLERPSGAPSGEFESRHDRSDLLPTDAALKGMKLLSMLFSKDPYVLYDRWGRILYEWECGYEPTWQDVFEITRRLV